MTAAWRLPARCFYKAGMTDLSPHRRTRPELPAGEKAIEAAILSHVAACGPGNSVSPSDIAMAMGPDWRTKLSAVRRGAVRLAQAGQIDILRKGRPVAPTEAKGVIRLRLHSPNADADAEPSDPAAE